ncbi:MAG: hypothetical protein R2867_27660 [Caldilineaceae bacterium]
MRNTVRFADGVATLHAQGIDICIEIGPKPTLLGMAEQIFDRMTDDKMTSASSVTRLSGHPVILSSCHPVMLPSLRESQNDTQQMLSSPQNCMCSRGVEADCGVDRGTEHRKLLLPTYPFQHQRYWVEVAGKKQRQGAVRPRGVGLRALVDKVLRSAGAAADGSESEFTGRCLS